MGRSQLGNAYATQPKRNADFAKMIIMSVIAAGQQVLISDHSFTEELSAEWAGHVVTVSNTVWAVTRPKTLPKDDKAFIKQTAQFILDTGVMLLHLRYGFTPLKSSVWMVRTTDMMSKAEFPSRE